MADKEQKKYVEVIGDTVYGKHLITTITISISFSLIGYFIGQQIFPKIAPAEMIKSYSLMLGIGGSLLALLINTFLFKPKRILNETPSTNAEISAVYEKMDLDIEEERQAILDDPVTAQEMKEQGIYEMFMGDGEEKR